MTQPNLDFSISYTGLRELALHLKTIDPALSKELRLAFKGIAEDVAGKVRGKTPQGKTGRARASVRVNATASGASVSEGSVKVPYVPFLDFGGTTGRGHKLGPNQGSIKRYFESPGRYLFPAVKVETPKTLAAMEHAVGNVCRGIDLEVTGG